ncbi:MAG TPA: hypothetical protein VHP58_04275 [Alphaproteobacteria bacterium]|nr:hypothetical protein [Alphaproteobacteria bacterium]
MGLRGALAGAYLLGLAATGAMVANDQVACYTCLGVQSRAQGEVARSFLQLPDILLWPLFWLRVATELPPQIIFVQR